MDNFNSSHLSDYPDDNVFRTSDTVLAAYLIEQGFDQPDIENNGRRAFYLFKRSDALLKAVHLFETDEAMGNVNHFYNNYRKLMRRIKEGY